MRIIARRKSVKRKNNTKKNKKKTLNLKVNHQNLYYDTEKSTSKITNNSDIRRTPGISSATKIITTATTITATSSTTATK